EGGLAWKQVEDGEIGCGFAIRHGGPLQHPPALEVVHMYKFIDETGFPYAGFPDHRHHLAMAGPGTFQGLDEGREFRLPAYKPRQAPRHPGLESTPQRT